MPSNRTALSRSIGPDAKTSSASTMLSAGYLTLLKLMFS